MTQAAQIGVRDTALWVEDTGEADLPVMVCLHSLFLDGSMFDGLAEAASGAYRVVRPDFRGQGRSAPASSDIVDMDTCAADIEALLDRLGLENVNLVAQSMGGDVAVRLVAKRPELFRTLVLLGTSARAEPPEQLEWIRNWIDEASKTGFVGEHLDALMAVMFGEATRADPAKAEIVAYWRGRMEALPLALWPAIRGVVERASAVPLLPKIPTPTLVLSGAEDMPRPPEWSDELAAGIPNAKLVRFDRVGHSVILEAPDRVIPEILAFIADPQTG